jgi:hypothetical protein
MSQPTRGKGGRYAKGNPGGPGRPRRAIELDYLRTLSERVTLPRWAKIVDAAIELAEAGDDKARSWLSSYALRRPGEAMPLARIADAEELGIDLRANDAVGVHEAYRDAENYVVLVKACEEASAAAQTGDSVTDYVRGVLGIAPRNGSTRP